ncbi:hypothetical protein ACOMHN_038396 [Nucella lapillus]
MATFTVEGETRKDEIKTFQTGHYISTNEAVWRIFSFDLHQRAVSKWSSAGVVCDTYQEACCLRELLEDGEHWSRTMEEAAATQMPSQLRHLFAILLTTCELPDPTGLWEAHKEDLSEDVLARTRRQNPRVQVEFNQFIYNEALLKLEAIITSLGSSMEACQMPNPNGAVTDMLQQEILRETNYNTEELVQYVEDNQSKLVPDQKVAFDTIMTSISNESGQLFFLDAPGGTGKTFLINLILAEVTKRQHIALAIASSGIAATLLDGGRTANSAFKLPLDLTRVETPACNITKRSAKAKLLQQCKVIIWDEATMSHKQAFQALDQSLQDLRDNNRVMGGVTLIMAGDFRQTLPVIIRGTRADAVNACIKSSNLWPVQSLTLQTNMRVHLNGDEAAGVFAGQLLQIGNGTIPTNESDKIQLPFGHVAKTEEDFIEKVFPNLLDHFKDRQWLSQRAILAPTNEAVTQVNRQLLSQLPSEEQVFKSVDSVLDEEAIH